MFFIVCLHLAHNLSKLGLNEIAGNKQQTMFSEIHQQFFKMVIVSHGRVAHCTSQSPQLILYRDLILEKSLGSSTCLPKEAVHIYLHAPSFALVQWKAEIST